MTRYLFVLFSALAMMLQSCKKDLLHWQSVQKLNSNTTCRLDNIRFMGDNVCIIAGGTKFAQSMVLRSVDGGYTWSNYSDTNAQKELSGMGVSPNGSI